MANSVEASVADMLKWRDRALLPTIALLALSLLVLLSPLGAEASRWFGLLVLAIVLMPLFGLGVFVLPLMLESDIRSRGDSPDNFGAGKEG